jgi:hypothetical protein
MNMPEWIAVIVTFSRRGAFGLYPMFGGDRDD